MAYLVSPLAKPDLASRSGPSMECCGGDHTEVDLYIVLQIGEIIVRLNQRQTVELHSKLLCIKQSRHGKNKRLRNWMIGRRIQ